MVGKRGTLQIIFLTFTIFALTCILVNFAGPDLLQLYSYRLQDDGGQWSAHVHGLSGKK